MHLEVSLQWPTSQCHYNNIRVIKRGHQAYDLNYLLSYLIVTYDVAVLAHTCGFTCKCVAFINTNHMNNVCNIQLQLVPYTYKNTRWCVKNECCCPRTVNISNVNFTSKISIPPEPVFINMGQQMSGPDSSRGESIRHESDNWRFESPSGRDIFCLKNFDTFARTTVRVSKMNAVARAQLTFQMLTLLQKYRNDKTYSTTCFKQISSGVVRVLIGCQCVAGIDCGNSDLW